MKFNIPQIPMPLFYKLGSILFGFGLMGYAINMKIQWTSINVGGKISMISTFFFQALFLTLFLGLYFATKKQMQIQMPKIIEDLEYKEFVRELNEDEDIDDKKIKDDKYTKVYHSIPKYTNNKKMMKGGKFKNDKKNIIKN